MPDPDASASSNRLRNLLALRTANVDGAFSSAFVALVTGSFLVGLIGLYRGPDWYLGLISSLPSFLGLLQIPGAIWGRSMRSYKFFVLPGGVVWRILYVPLVFLPFLDLPDQAALAIILACVVIAAAASQVVAPVYNDWLAELVPPSSRGWFFGRRNAIAGGVGAAAGLAGGVTLDALRRAGQDELGFSLIFGAGVVMSFLSLAFFLRMPDTPRAHPQPLNWASSLRGLQAPFRDRAFMRLLLFLVIFVAGQSFAGLLWFKYAFESLNMPFTVLQLCGITGAIGGIGTARIWGYLADRYGNKPILVLLGFGLALTPAMWIVCVPGNDFWNAVILISGHLYSGAVWAGVGITQFNLLLTASPSQERTSYIGVGLATQAVVGGLSPLLGSLVMQQLRLAIDPTTAYKIIFGLTMAMRFGSVFLLLPVREEGATSLRRTIRHLKQVSPRGYGALRRLARTTDPEEREKAISVVGSDTFLLASDEVIKALDDPRPRVRRSAARSAASLDDPRAGEILLRRLRDHPELADEETIAALGSLRSVEAVPTLAELVRTGPLHVRLPALQALGRIGEGEAVSCLAEAARGDFGPEARRAALQALADLRVESAREVFAQAVLAEDPAVRFVAAEGIAELGWPVADALRESLRRYRDEAACEVAYALAVVGNRRDAASILDAARRARSVAGKRRCLLGLARLFGAEEIAYRLMLLEGVALDTAILEALRRGRETPDWVDEATALYAAGSEREATALLVRALAMPELEPLLDHPVPEAFLVAVAVYAHVQDAAEKAR